MPMPSTKEKRTKISIVDGSEVRVEYEVDSHKPLKRLFLFPSSVRASPWALGSTYHNLPRMTQPHPIHQLL